MATANSIAERLERLPIGKFHRRFITLVSLGEWFDMYDLFMVGYVGAALQSSNFLSLHQFSVLIAAGFLGMFLGTVLFGLSSDRIGRRSAFILMLLIYSVFTLLGAMAPSASWLIVLRFFAGIGIGAETVIMARSQSCATNCTVAGYLFGSPSRSTVRKRVLLTT